MNLQYHPMNIWRRLIQRLERNPFLRQNLQIVLILLGIATVTSTGIATGSDAEDEMQAAIENAISYDPYAQLSEIKVSVRDGVVTLTGLAYTIMARQKAELLVNSMSGVRGIVNHIQIKTYSHLDAEKLKNKIIKAFDYDPTLKGKIETQTDHFGNVTLSGKLPSLQAKAHAENIAKSTYGVTFVDNRIVAKNNNGLDQKIETELESKFSLHDSKRFRPKSAKDSATLMKASENFAKGKKELPFYLLPRANKLARKSDEDLKSSIESELFWSLSAPHRKVQVIVQNGYVTVKGRLSSWKEHNAVIENVYEGGAIWVENALEVSAR